MSMDPTEYSRVLLCEPGVWLGTVEYTEVTTFLCQTRGSVTGLDKKTLQWILIHPFERT